MWPHLSRQMRECTRMKWQQKTSVLASCWWWASLSFTSDRAFSMLSAHLACCTNRDPEPHTHTHTPDFQCHTHMQHLHYNYYFSYLLINQVHDSLFLLFSKHFCLQLFSLNLCNSFFLISHLLTVSFFFLVLFPNILPSNISQSHTAIYQDPSIYVYDNIILCAWSIFTIFSLIFFPSNLFSPDPHSKASSLLLAACINVHVSTLYRVSQKKVDPLRFSTIFSLGLSLFA